MFDLRSKIFYAEEKDSGGTTALETRGGLKLRMSSVSNAGKISKK